MECLLADTALCLSLEHTLKQMKQSSYITTAVAEVLYKTGIETLQESFQKFEESVNEFDVMGTLLCYRLEKTKWTFWIKVPCVSKQNESSRKRTVNGTSTGVIDTTGGNIKIICLNEAEDDGQIIKSNKDISIRW